jgi:prevent-host-death family protein
MPKTVAANEAKQRLGALLGYVNEQGDEVIVERHGRPTAVLMSVAAYDEVKALREQ